ncbi:MAG: nadD [Planctomycetaceae bacterium]|nr:nadD [Planctomycetaceae bacterium]
MRLGLYGGTFDPVHLGHLILAETCREQCRLDRVIFIPAGVPPHKQGRELTAGNLRADMLEFAIAGYPEFSVDRSEIKRTGPSYTVETLRDFQREHPGDELFLLMGADSLNEFLLWKDPREIATLSSLIVVNRGRVSPPNLGPLVPHLGAAAVDRIRCISMPGIDLSATELRERARQGQSLRYLTPRAVERFIVEHQVYPA